MRRQRGQSAVEFALMAPIVFLMIFAAIYGGMMFMEYMHYSNAVRTVAREVALSYSEEKATAKEQWLKQLWTNEISVKLYEPDVSITQENNDVRVVVTFTRVGSLPFIVNLIGFPPKYVRALDYKMQIEQSGS